MKTALDAFWMPFTSNRQFKARPRLVASAQGVAYRTPDGREVPDGMSGLWCVGAGHGHPRIAEAMKRQIDTLDFAASFQAGHPGAFELAERIGALTPPGLDRVFLTNSGSEAVDTALKITLAHERACGQGQRQVFIGRERAFHGVGFGGDVGRRHGQQPARLGQRAAAQRPPAYNLGSGHAGCRVRPRRAHARARRCPDSCAALRSSVEDIQRMADRLRLAIEDTASPQP